MTLEVRASDLALWDAATSAMEVEAITYELRIGTLAEDARLVGTFRVE